MGVHAHQIPKDICHVEKDKHTKETNRMSKGMLIFDLHTHAKAAVPGGNEASETVAKRWGLARLTVFQ